MYSIINGRFVIDGQIQTDLVLNFDNKINITRTVPQGSQIIDAKGNIVAPGMIDVHIHGINQHDTMEANHDALTAMSSYLPKTGVTSFLPTTMSMSAQEIKKALSNVKDFMSSQNPDGSKVLGANLEGPFINPNYCGAQDPKYIINPASNLIDDYLDVIKLATIAPEVDKDYLLTKKLSDKGIVVSIGHSGGTFDDCMSAISCGASHFTHLFNAMSPLNHREPGVAGAALISDKYVELIADMVHVTTDIFELVLKAKSIDKIVLITDCTMAGGMPDGEYLLGGQKVYLKNGRVTLDNGALAGSALTMDRAILNFYRNSSLTLAQCFTLACDNPAKVLGIYDSKGSIADGKDADIIIVDDNMNVLQTILEGKIIYSA